MRISSADQAGLRDLAAASGLESQIGWDGYGGWPIVFLELWPGRSPIALHCLLEMDVCDGHDAALGLRCRPPGTRLGELPEEAYAQAGLGHNVPPPVQAGPAIGLPDRAVAVVFIRRESHFVLHGAAVKLSRDAS